VKNLAMAITAALVLSTVGASAAVATEGGAHRPELRLHQHQGIGPPAHHHRGPGRP
jgi:hypothetical protein